MILFAGEILKPIRNSSPRKDVVLQHRPDLAGETFHADQQSRFLGDPDWTGTQMPDMYLRCIRIYVYIYII